MKTAFLLLGLASTLVLGCGGLARTDPGTPDAAATSAGSNTNAGSQPDGGFTRPIIDALSIVGAPAPSTNFDGAPAYTYTAMLSFHDDSEVVTQYQIADGDGDASSSDLLTPEQTERGTNIEIGLTVPAAVATQPINVDLTIYGKSGAASLPASVTLDPPTK